MIREKFSLTVFLLDTVRISRHRFPKLCSTNLERGLKMKRIFALFVIIILTTSLGGCSLGSKLSSMDAKMDKVAASAQDMDTQLKQMSGQITQMAEYTKELVDIMKKLIGGLTGTGTGTPTPAPSPGTLPDKPVADLSTKSTQELQETADLVRKAAYTKAALEKANIKVAGFDPVTIAPPPQNIPTENQALIVEISSLMTQLQGGN
jgi:outer membrane murein-binding lipoprotein Lpp